MPSGRTMPRQSVRTAPSMSGRRIGARWASTCGPSRMEVRLGHSFCKLFVSPWMCGATAVAMTCNWTSGEANNARSKVVTSNTQSAPSPMWRHLADRSGYRSGLRQIRPMSSSV